MENVVITSAVRTPVGRYMGALKTIEAYDLGALVIDHAIKRNNIDPSDVDEVVMGQAYQSGEYVNIARMSVGQDEDGENNIIFMKTDTSIPEKVIEELCGLPMVKTVTPLEF